MQTEEIIVTFFQIGLLTLFIGVFFFSYVSKVERDVTTHQINYIVDAFTKDLAGFVPSPVRRDLAARLSTLDAPDQAELDERVKENNAKLQEKGFQVLVIPVFLALIALCSYGLVRRIHGAMLYSVAASLVVVAITYMGFLGLVVNQYLAVDTNNIKKRIVEVLQTIASRAPQIDIAPTPFPFLPELQ